MASLLSNFLEVGLLEGLDIPERNQKLATIEALLQSTSQQLASAYPLEVEISVCEQTKSIGQAALRLRLEEKRFRKIRELLEFD